MGSMTAQVLIGWEDMYHGGLAPTHALWLHENSRPAWILEAVEIGDGGGKDTPSWTTHPVTWIPSRPEHILDDGLLLLACHVLREERVLGFADDRLPALLYEEWVDLTKLPELRLTKLRAMCRRIELDFKLVITVFGGSSLEGQLPVLDQYAMNLEVCTVTYSRLRSSWSGETQTGGSLEASWGAGGATPDRYREVSFPTDLPGVLADDIGGEKPE